MKIRWSEAERQQIEAEYRKLLLSYRGLPRWYRRVMAERLATLHLAEAAKKAEQDAEVQQSPVDGLGTESPAAGS